MKTDQQRIKELEDKVASFEKSRHYQKAAELKVLEAARAYSMMKVFEKKIDHNGMAISYCGGNVDGTIEILKNTLLHSAESLLLEDALAGSHKY